MCEPATIALAATAVAASGKIVGGINANNQAKYTAKVAQMNADMDRRAAADAIERGQTEEQRRARKTAQTVGAQRAVLSANGVEVDFGSSGALQADARAIGAEDTLTIRQNALRETQGFEINASNNVAQAASARAKGKAALIGSFFDAGSTILSGASQNSRLRASRAGAA